MTRIVNLVLFIFSSPCAGFTSLTRVTRHLGSFSDSDSERGKSQERLSMHEGVRGGWTRRAVLTDRLPEALGGHGQVEIHLDSVTSSSSLRYVLPSAVSFSHFNEIRVSIARTMRKEIERKSRVTHGATMTSFVGVWSRTRVRLRHREVTPPEQLLFDFQIAVNEHDYSSVPRACRSP